MGNMDVGRMEALLSFAEVLESVSASARLHLYGKLPYNAAARRAEQRQNIVYHGFVPYEEVQNAIRHSDLLLHTESFSAFYRRDLQYAFSTKIADSLGSGKPFLIFAPDSFACVQYLKEHDAAFCASDPEELRRILDRILRTPGVRDSHIQSALKLAKSNHSVIANSGTFQKIIAEIL